ncbi:MAG: hypothetical protein JRD89_18000 [Deltaproteobacteria bacterium]|nr:hypothetical protein [Deltaproteobacteria bacterium]
MAGLREALAQLNTECRKAGVCKSGEAVLSAPLIKHAAELWKEGGPKVVVSVWTDGMVTSCVFQGDGKQCCYTAEEGGDELYFAWQAHLTSPEVGYKIKSVEAEG